MTMHTLLKSYKALPGLVWDCSQTIAHFVRSWHTINFVTLGPSAFLPPIPGVEDNVVFWFTLPIVFLVSWRTSTFVVSEIISGLSRVAVFPDAPILLSSCPHPSSRTAELALPDRSISCVTGEWHFKTTAKKGRRWKQRRVGRRDEW